MTTSTTSITVDSITDVNPIANTVNLGYSNGTQPTIESSAGTIVYSLGAFSPAWAFKGTIPAPPSDITSKVSDDGSTLTFTDLDTVRETFNFQFQVSNGGRTYTSQDPEIVNQPPGPPPL